MCLNLLICRFSARRHAETHIEGFTHPCSNCDKTFSTRNGLGVHKLRQHPEDKAPKPFNCDICDKAYSTKIAVKVHKKRNHRY